MNSKNQREPSALWALANNTRYEPAPGIGLIAPDQRARNLARCIATLRRRGMTADAARHSIRVESSYSCEVTLYKAPPQEANALHPSSVSGSM
ncbi:hypothetical protein M407DRAFT_34457 [Tulasnella calospora MUT 4182]|uniref:Uncharacterized protein n=1 Tax=Tulasnella calospora MUT 4182 TaxID=1051891 RepID=A0A0C3PND5_9AGAM|nr:hypothetical protein M407DRAFT_34457 [Tulasnella calospora MUT 4182]